MSDQSALLRQELAERRAYLLGAKETAVMVEATLANASDLALARHALLVPVRERVALLQQAIDSTDAALAPAVCDACKATPCRCYIAVRRLDEAAVEIVATDEDGDTTDSWCVIVGDDGRLTVDRASDPCYICGASVAPDEGWHRQEADGVHRHWCPEHQPVWSRAGLSEPPLKVAHAVPMRVLDPDAALGLPPGTYEASSRRRQRMETTATVTVLSVWGKLDVGVDSSPVPASHVVWLVAAADTGWPRGLTVLRKASGERLRSDDPVYAGETVVVVEEVATDA